MLILGTVSCLYSSAVSDFEVAQSQPPNTDEYEQDQEQDDDDELTFARVSLPHESPEELRAVMTIGRLVEVLLDEAVPVLVAQVVVFHRADE